MYFKMYSQNLFIYIHIEQLLNSSHTVAKLQEKKIKNILWFSISLSGIFVSVVVYKEMIYKYKYIYVLFTSVICYKQIFNSETMHKI